MPNVHVKAKRERAATTERFNRESLNTEMIRDNRDLVRYSSDVGIADQGRHSKGFSIRGVEDNRVGISIDNVALPDSEENSLYKRYGNLNTSRQSIDTELIRSVEVVKGGDSFNHGSGNIGGGVNYRTLNARDIVSGDKNWGIMLKSGYASRNREWANTAGFGWANNTINTLLLYSQRYGHETKSAGGFTIPEGVQQRLIGHDRQIPDSAQHRNHSFLTKTEWHITDAHRVSLSLNGQQGKNHIIEDSGVILSSRWREADDRFKRRTSNFSYEYTPDSRWLSSLRINLDNQKTKTSADNDEGYRANGSQPKKTSDINTRIFSTNFKRLSVKMGFQPLSFGRTTHDLTVHASASTRHFDILHIDYSWPTNFKPETSTMMYPIQTRQYMLSLHDKFRLNDVFSGYSGIRFDHTVMSPQDLGSLECSTCLVPKPQNAHFKNWNWILGLDAQLSPIWTAGYSVGTGFRVPNASEMYFDFRKSTAGKWLSNPNLKAERSLSQAISLRGNGKYGQFSLALHHTRYKDFLYEQEKWGKSIEYGREFSYPMQQMQNIDSAKIYGLEFAGKLKLNAVSKLPEGWTFMTSVGIGKSKLSNHADLLSMQPPKVILGLDYENPNGKWGIFSRLTYYARKKPKNAKYYKADQKVIRQEFDPWYGRSVDKESVYYVKLDTWQHLNQAAWVFDLFGYYKPRDNLTIRAGIYNAFNRKYHTWDALRGLNTTGSIVNSVDMRPKKEYGGYPGLQRFYSPGRNFAFSIEYKF